MTCPTTTIHIGDAWALADTLELESIDCIVTSPPYWGLRDYGHEGQFGLEATPEEYVARLVELFRLLRPALKDCGTVWLNLGDGYATGVGSGRSMGGDCFGKQNKVIDAGSYPVCQPNRMLIPGLKPKDLCGIPWRVAFALQSDGWYLRSDIIWAKPNPMPESVTDRPTKSHEYLFLLAKSQRYYFDQEAVRESAVGQNDHDLTGSGCDAPGQTVQIGNRKTRVPAGWDTQPGAHGTIHREGRSAPTYQDYPAGSRNIRTVWTIPTQPYPGAHFAVFPAKLIDPCIKAGCPEGGTVLDPFLGSGTTAEVARRLGRSCIGFELNAEYKPLIDDRLKQGVLL